MSSKNILKNVYHLNNLENPTAELLYTLLALWRNCPTECTDNFISFLEKAAKQAMKFKDLEFIEFFRRVLDFPRRGRLNIRNPDFLELVNHTVAEAAGAKIYLAPETFLALRSRSSWIDTRKAAKEIATPSLGRTKRKTYKRWSSDSSKTTRGGEPTRGTQPEPRAVEVKKIGAESSALDASAAHLMDGPFLDPKAKVSASNCCYC